MIIRHTPCFLHTRVCVESVWKLCVFDNVCVFLSLETHAYHLPLPPWGGLGNYSSSNVITMHGYNCCYGARHCQALVGIVRQ